MKSLVITVAVLVATTMVHGFDHTRAETFKHNIARCRHEVGLHQYQPHKLVLLCVFGADGRIYNADGAIMKDAVLKLLQDVIDNLNTLQQAQMTFETCYGHVVGNGTVSQKHTDILGMCSASIIGIFLNPK